MIIQIKHFVFWLLVLCSIYYVNRLSFSSINYKLSIINNNIYEIKTVYQKRDTLFWKHLTKCSFISNDEIKSKHGKYIILNHL